MKYSIALASVVCATAVLPALAQDIPVLSADSSHVPNPPPAIEPNLRGYATRGVQGETLAEMLQRCRSTVATRSAVVAARCDQLQRTLKNQPGNSVR